MSINSVSISGYLTRDGELRYTQSGTPVLDLGVAVNERVKNSQGQWEDRANFVDCTMFGKRAESIAQYINKGTYVVIQGRLHYSSWAKDGQKRSKLEVIADELDFKNIDGAKHATQVAREVQATYDAQQPAYDTQTSVYDSDIPF